MRELRDKIIVIAGGATGIGAASAMRLAEEDATVVIGDINEAGAASTAARIRAAGGNATAIHVDVSDEASVRSLFDETLRRHGRIDGVHVNAANLSLLARDTDILSLSQSVFDQSMSINLFGCVLCTRHAVPPMLERGSGVIVYTSSAASFGGGPPAYSMSKAGVNNLMRHVVATWGKHGIRANAIAPGFVLTQNALASVSQDIQDGALALSKSPFHALPEDIAAAVAFLMSADARCINGQVISVDGGMVMR